MHEMGIAMQLLRVVEESLPPGEPVRLKSIRLRLGKLTAVVPGSLRMCMEIVAKDTVAEGATLEFDEVPVRLACRDCGAETTVEQPPFVCGSCGGKKVDVVGGREMIVESIEVEDLPASGSSNNEDKPNAN